jgi:cytochrome c oxidase subunit II
MPMPTFSAVAVAGMALLLGAALVSARQDPVTASAPREIEVVAKKFTFEPAKVEVTEGERIRLMVRSADGVHGIEIKKLDINKMVPGDGTPVQIDFVAPGPGTYEVMCSEYCGDGHETMTGMLVVQAKAK